VGRCLPRHVAIIMDGNGRWAENRGLARIDGHREGAKSVREITRCARRIGIKALTLYAFSAQNWARPADEVRALMDLLREYLEDERSEILENQISLRAIGEIDRLPDHVKIPLQDLIRDSAHHDGMTLTLALSYGGRESLIDAIRIAAADAVSGKLSPHEINAKDLGARLQTSFLPDLDLMIRTSGEKRLSNFLLWEAAYAELIFAETMWPDFREPDFMDALDEFQNRERRFGKTAQQTALG